MEFEKDYFKMGDRYGRVLFLREYASYIKDSMVAELTDLNRNLMMSIDVVPVPTELSTNISPPNFSIIFFVITNPNPTGRGGRTPTITFRRLSLTIWNSRKRK